MTSFRFKRFEVKNEASALKVGTDAVLLGCAATIPSGTGSVLDIGTGTGVIALILAQRIADSGAVGFRAIGIDIDAPSSKEAAENFKASPWSDNLLSLNTPLSGYCPPDPFDLIVSNPPYFESSLKNPDAREAAARHNTSLAIGDIFAFCAKNLSESGTLSLILPAGNETAAIRSAASFGLFPYRIIRIKTTEAKPEKRLIFEFSRERKPIVTEYLTLMRGQEKSRDYSRLTEDFYL